MNGHSQLEAFLEAAPDAMVVVDQRGRIVLVNTQAEELFGFARGQLLGEPVEILVPERFRAAHTRDRHQYFVRPSVRPMGAGLELFGRRRDGAEFPVEISLSPIEVDGRMLAMAAVRNITERKQAEAERANLIREQAARVEAEAANRIKDEFLITLSHELRTPLNAILGWARLLREGELDPAQSDRALETIERNTRIQVQLIEDLLDLSRIIGGKMQLEMRSVDLLRTIEAAVEVVRPAAGAKGLTVTSSLEPGTGPVAGDPDRLQQVIWNLLSNSIKFTPPGGRVDVRLERVGDEAQITVSDTGQGIGRDFLPHVFDRFRQADSSTTRAQGGLGLGLAIVRQLVELHGGSVTAGSEGPGRGATFRVRLPLQTTPFAGLAEPVEARLRQRLDGLRVLVVDDQADERELFAIVLEGQGAAVSAVGSAAEALHAVERWNPDVLVSDIAMPLKNGYELLREIRRLGPHRGGHVPAVAVTAYARVEDRDRALSAGFQMYVSKPIEPGRLVEVVAALGRAAR